MERAGLSLLDWTVVAVYLAAVLVLGIRAAGRQKTVRDYFLGDRSLPWWAVALSIIATETSAATYVGTPGNAYRSSWEYLQLVLGFVAARLFLAFYFIHVYYRADVVTVYGFLRERFGESVRTVAAILFLLGRVIGSGVRLFAACMALRIAAGWSGEGGTIAAIVVLGLLALAYTYLGGIKSVVWAECVLGVTFLLGGLLAAVILWQRLPGGIEAAAALPEFWDKVRVFHFDLGEEGNRLASARPFWIAFGGGFVLNLATHGTDQDMVQRMLTCPDARRGGLSLIASAALILPLNVIFLSVGTLLYCYHRLRPEAMPLGVTNADDQLLLFIGRQVPAGLAGLVVAGLFAAAVSSHTSVLNALASTSLADFYRPHIVRNASEAHYLKASRAFTLFWGVVLIAVAAAFMGSEKSVLDLALSALTYFYGGLLGVFLLGIFTRRGSAASATAGMLLSVPVVLLLQLREFLERPELAPTAARAVLRMLPEAVAGGVREWVPRLAFPLWIVAGTAVAFGVGVLGRGRNVKS